MARGRGRPERRPGRQSRDPVPAAFPNLEDVGRFLGDDPDDDDPSGGSAGVREPRRPRPHGPVSGAGVKPMPEVELAAALPNPPV